MSFPDIKIDWSDGSLWIALAFMLWNPVYWNIIARFNYNTKCLEKLFKSSKRAVIFIAFTILLLGFYRDWRFKLALSSQPISPLLNNMPVCFIGWICVAIGLLLVTSSFYALGFYATFLGDYFGIYLPEKVTSFPFNICSDPMYFGSTLNFLGTALLYQSEAGIFMSFFVALVYYGASHFEGEFTAKIYDSLRSHKKKR